MHVNIIRVPGAARKSLHRGASTVVSATGFPDYDFSALTPYHPLALATSAGALYDGDVGIATGIGTDGGSTGWATGFFNDFAAWDVSNGPLSRFTGAT